MVPGGAVLTVLLPPSPPPPIQSLPPAPLTVLVVTHNHQDSIRRCLTSARERLPPGTEILVLDNASEDDSCARAATVPDIRVAPLSGNYGFSGAMNLGLDACRSELVLTLGPDVFLQEGFWSALSRPMGSNTAMAGPLMLSDSQPEIIDDAGTILTTGFQFKSRGAGETDRGQYRSSEVLAVCGGCCLLRRDAIEDLRIEGELFDFHFFAYKEDVDLGLRAHLLGWTCRFEPRARARHQRIGGNAFPPVVQKLSIRNRWLLLLKNLDLSTLALNLPQLSAFELYQIYNHGRAYRHLGMKTLISVMLRKRRQLLSRRRLSPAEYRRRLASLPRELPVET